MPDVVLSRLLKDHDAFKRLHVQIERQCDVPSDKIDTAQVEAILWYLRGTAVRRHEALEDRVFDFLSAHMPTFSEIYDLSHDHARSRAALTARLGPPRSSGECRNPLLRECRCRRMKATWRAPAGERCPSAYRG